MKSILAAFIALLFIAGCTSKNGDVVKTESGLMYKDDTVGTGKVVNDGDMVSIQFTGWVAKDSANLFSDWSKDTSKTYQTIGSSKQIGQPIKYVLGKNQFIKGLDEGIVGMKVGGTRTIIIPSKLAYGEKGMGPIPPNSDLKVVVELENAKKPVTVTEWDVDSSKFVTTPSGLKYAIIKEGEGPTIDSGKVVTVNYSLFLKDGKKIESSVERDEPFKFKYKVQPVIKGWEEGISLLKKGSKAQLIIPPSLGYGARDNGPIPANSTLVFDIEVLDVK